MSQRVKTSARALVLTRSSQPESGHLRKNACSSPAKRKKYLCKYQKAWEAEFSWLSHSDRNERKEKKGEE